MVLAAIAFINGERIRHEFNRRAEGSRDVITLRTPGDEYSVIVSGASILRNSHVPIYSPLSPGNLSKGNISFDLNGNDLFASALRGVERGVTDDIQNSAALKILLAKNDWSNTDRATWDHAIINMICTRIAHIPGLDILRTDRNIDSRKTSVKRTRYLNDISTDIRNSTHEQEYDCEAMSVVKIVLLEKIANAFLTNDKRSNYYYFHGFTDFNASPAQHSFIVSEKNGKIIGIIESTDNNNAWGTVISNGDFADIASGKSFLRSDGSVYGLNVTSGDISRMKEESNQAAREYMNKNRGRENPATPVYNIFIN